MSDPLLEATDLSAGYGDDLALRGANLRVDAGEVLGVIGPSGSGKSTLLHCLSGLIQPRSGSVSFRGRRIDGLSDAALSALRCTHFGFVFQFSDLVPELSLLENTTLPLRFAGTRRHEAEQRAASVLDALGVGSLAARRPSEVSGGQLQRAAIARALVHEPAVIFADEPTGALDSETGEHVLELMLDASRAHGASLVLVTHDPRVVADVDRVVSVLDGVVSVAPVTA